MGCCDDFYIEDGVLLRYMGSEKIVAVPDGVTAIEKYAFDDQEEIFLPESVRTLKTFSFRGCDSLKTVHLPKNLREIESAAFYWCEALEEIHIPDQVEVIAGNAFYHCQALKKVTIGKSVRIIGSGAFQGCEELQQIEGGENLEEIWDEAFSGCTALEKIVIPEKVKQIGESAFFKCTNLLEVSLPASLERIGEKAFYGCFQIHTLTIPQAVQKIENKAFYCCGRMQRVTILSPDVDMVKYSFDEDRETAFYAPFLPLAKFPTLDLRLRAVREFCHVYEGHTTIPPLMLENYKKYIKGHKRQTYDLILSDQAVLHYVTAEKILTMADVHMLLERAESSAVKSALQDYQSRVFPGKTYKDSLPGRDGVHILTTAEAKEKWGFKNLGEDEVVITKYKGSETEVTVPQQIGKRAVVEIGEAAFSPEIAMVYRPLYQPQQAIKHISLPEGLKRIGWGAFDGCCSLEEIIIPESVESIAGRAFCRCENITEFSFKEGTKEIPKGIFWGCHRLHQVHIPDSVECIGPYAFTDCPSLTEIQIPEAVTYIGRGAFERCTGLTSMRIPDGVTEIESELFAECRALENVQLPAHLKAINFEIPYRGRVPHQQTFGAFYGCQSLREIDLPATLTHIGDAAFYGCTSLQGVTLPDGIEKIGKHTFTGCTALQSLHIPKDVHDISTNSLRGCSSLRSIEVDADNPLYEGRGAMLIRKKSHTVLFASGASGKVTISEDIQALAEAAFCNAHDLLEIVLPGTLSKIGEHCFYGCDGLTRAEIQAGISLLPESMFEDCKNLKTVTISETVSYIDDDVFCGCENVRLVTPAGSYAAEYAKENSIAFEEQK